MSESGLRHCRQSLTPLLLHGVLQKVAARHPLPRRARHPRPASPLRVASGSSCGGGDPGCEEAEIRPSRAWSSCRPGDARSTSMPRTLQVAMPHSAVIVLTDPASAFSVGKSNTAVLPIKGDYSRGNLMLQRIISYIEFLETRLKGLLERPKQISHYIFTDSDIAVVDELGHIFQNYPRFHLALSFRNNKDQPINSGFIAVRGTRDGILRLFTSKDRENVSC